MAKISHIKINRFRSIEDVTLTFPENKPLILIGENNTGKSNIVAAINLLLGESYPTYKTIEERDYFHRQPSHEIRVEAEFHDGSLYVDKYKKIEFSHVKNRDGADDSMLTSYNNKLYLKQNARASCMLVYIAADRNISWQLSYSSKYTMLSKLMHRFHEELQAKTGIKTKLKEIFNATKAEFDKVDEFKEFKRFLQEDFKNIIAGMSHKLYIDLEAYNPANFFQSIRVLPKEGDEVRSFEELGTGEQQILAISFAHAYSRAFKRGVILVIEEPESHLHPLAQKWLAKRIDEFCGEGLQVIFTTHSPNFVRIEDLEGLALVRKDQDGDTFVKQLTKEGLADFCVKYKANSGKTSKDTVIPFYAANTSTEILEGFFAKLVVLVEGQTEAMSLPEYFSALGIDTVKEGIDFIPVFGEGNIARFYRLFKAYGLPVYVIFDNDDEDDKSGLKRKDICATLNIDPDKVMAITKLDVQDECAIFGVDYETTLRELIKEYEKVEKEVRGFMGYDPESKKDGKPLVARQAARRILANYEKWEPEKKERLIDFWKIKERLQHLLNQKDSK